MAWFGFHHVDQTISYQLAIGSNPGDEDVVNFTDVGESSHMFSGLTLQPFKVVILVLVMVNLNILLYTKR